MGKTGVKMNPSSFWKILNNDQLKTLDDAAYEILRDVGMIMEDDELLKMAQKMGCAVNFEKKAVMGIPEDLVRRNVAKAPRNFSLAARDPDWDLVIEGASKNQFWQLSNGASDRLIYDEGTKTYSRRRTSCKDIAYAVRIGDGIDDFDAVARVFDATEESQLGLPLEVDRMNTVLQNSTKHATILTTTASDDREYDYVARPALPTSAKPAGISNAKRPANASPMSFSIAEVIAPKCLRILGDFAFGRSPFDFSVPPFI